MNVRKSNRTTNTNRNTHTDEALPQTGEQSAAAPMGDTETAHKVVALRPSKGNRSNIFEQEAVEVSEDTGKKLIIEQEARQKLAEARDLWAQGEGKAEEAAETAGKAALLLSSARIDGSLTQPQVSNALGDIFGYKPKADGTPGTTPAGQGEAIRKRIVRLAAAAEFLSNGGDAKDGFFKGVTADTSATITLRDGRKLELTVKDVYSMTQKGELGFWAGYEAFAAIKRATAVSIPLAFNPKRISEIAEQLQGDGAAKVFVGNAALRRAYSQLWAIIRVVGEEAAEIASAA